MTDPKDFPVYRTLFNIVCAIVDYPHDVTIKTAWSDEGGTFTVSVHPEDAAKLIGKQGQTARAIRTIIGGIAMKGKRRFTIFIDDEVSDQVTPPPGTRSH